MNPIVFIPCGGPSGGTVRRGHILTVPCAAARANQNSHRERNGAKASSAICHGPVFSVRERTVRAIITNVVAPGSVPDADTIKAVRRKFIRSLKALRSLSSRPSIKFLAEQSRGKAPVRHVDFLSFRFCVAGATWTKGPTRCCQSLTRNAQ